MTTRRRPRPAQTGTIPPRPHMGDQLDKLLRDLGLTQAEFARRLEARGADMSRQNLSLKIARADWNAQDLWTIATTANVPTDYFFGVTTPTAAR